MGCCQHCWPSWGRCSSTHQQVQCARSASVRQAGRQAPTRRGASREPVRAALPPPPFVHSLLALLFTRALGTIRASIRVRPPGTKRLLAAGAAAPVPSGSHFNSGVTQLQSFPNSFGCCHPTILRTPPLPSEASPLVFAFTSYSICRNSCTHMLKSNV